MDYFEKYLTDHKCDQSCPALTCPSYGEIYKRDHHSELSPGQMNTDLATLGDAVLKLVLCDILYHNGCKKISEEKKKYECDQILIEKIAEKYQLLKYMKFDESDEKIKQEYVYYKSKNGKTIHTKYIATTVEAVIAAIYLEQNSLAPIRELVLGWFPKLKTK